MKVIILAGGLGTRISEETLDKPKPMVLIGGKPILWHIMNIYSKQGFSDFLVAGGYKWEIIETWARDLTNNWSIRVLDTGPTTQTGGRIKICMDEYPNQAFLATYGDGVGNVNINQLISFHQEKRRIATLTAVRPPARFGHLQIVDGQVTRFGEKNQSDVGWINGGFFVLSPDVREFIHATSEPFETGALPRLVGTGQLSAFHHFGFWQPMDTLREKQDLESHTKDEVPPWLIGL